MFLMLVLQKPSPQGLIRRGQSLSENELDSESNCLSDEATDPT